MRGNNAKEANLPQQDVNVTDLAKALTPTDLATANICAIDPNRGQVFSASYGFGDRAHQIRQLSTKEYYTITGSMRHTRKEVRRRSEEQMEDILLGIPTAKTSRVSTYFTYVTYVLLHLKRILAFNGFSTAQTRFYLYQGVQRARDEMVNVLLNGGKKYNKRKRKNTKSNRKKRKERRGRKQPGIGQPRQPGYELFYETLQTYFLLYEFCVVSE